MMQTFTSQIRLDEKSLHRTSELIQLLNNMHISSNAMMVVLDAFQISGTEVTGNIQLTHNELKVTFGVITPNIDELILFASRFNMASAMNCTIRYRIKGESLYLIYKPPNEKLEEVLRDFFELTEKSEKSNWTELNRREWRFTTTDSHWVSVGINLKKRNTSCEVFLFDFIIILLILKFLQFLELHKLLI